MKFVIAVTGLLLMPAVVSAQGMGKIEQIEIVTNDVARVIADCKLADWKFIFSQAEPGTFGDRLMRYKSREELVEDSEAQTKVYGEYLGSEKVTQLIADRVEEKMDFSKRDLVIVRRSTGGPPFGEFRQMLKDGTAYFWIEEPARDGPSGLALKSSFDFYTIPKGLEVSNSP